MAQEPNQGAQNMLTASRKAAAAPAALSSEQWTMLRQVAAQVGGLEGALLRLCLTVLDAQAARLAAVEQAVNTHQWHVSCCPVLIGALDAVLLGGDDAG